MNIQTSPFSICVGLRVGGHPPTNFSYRPKDARIPHLLTLPRRDAEKTYAKLVKNTIFRALKLRGLKHNEISTPNCIYQNDQHKKTYRSPGDWTKILISQESA